MSTAILNGLGVEKLPTWLHVILHSKESGKYKDSYLVEQLFENNVQ